MKYTEKDLPDEFECINSAGTCIHLNRKKEDLFILSSLSYDQTYPHSAKTVLTCINNGTWNVTKIIKTKEFNYEIY